MNCKLQFTILFVLLFVFNACPQFKTDPGFGNNGVVVYDGNGYEGAWDVVIQNDDKLVVAGWAHQDFESQPDVLLMRFNNSGLRDTTFRSGNLISYSSWSWEDAYALSLQRDQKIVVAGRFYNGSNWDFMVLRCLQDGTIDSSFAYRGFRVIDVYQNDVAFAIKVQPDNKILAAGSCSSNIKDIALVRINPDGSLDEGFGNRGVVTTDLFHNTDVPFALNLQNDGKIVLAGWCYIGNNCDFAIVRYNSDGSLDKSFGSGGIVVTDLNNMYNSCHSLVIQEDGKIVVAGYTYFKNRPDTDIMLSRYNGDGTLDNSFGNGGIVLTDINGGDEFAWKISVQLNGKLIVAGYHQFNYEKHLLLLRYNSDGMIDNSLDEQGYSILDINGGDEEVRGLALNMNQDVILTGYVSNTRNTDLFVVKYPSELQSLLTDEPLISFLYQNYPNPFNSNAIIRYIVKNESRVILKIFDITGNEVLTILDDYKSPGIYEVPIDLSNLPSAVYFYQLRLSDRIETRKMVHLK